MSYSGNRIERGNIIEIINNSITSNSTTTDEAPPKIHTKNRKNQNKIMKK